MGRSFAERGRVRLNRAWDIVLRGSGGVISDPALAAACDAVFGATDAGYRKAIIIQAAGKSADFELDAQAMQKGSGELNTWDAREFAKQVFVPWNLASNFPFTHTADPYVSNPYRIPRFDPSVRSQRRDKVGFDATLQVLEKLNVATSPAHAFKNLVEVMSSLRRFVANRSIDYPLPNRASILDTSACVESFVSVRSGGARLQAVVLALANALKHSGMSYSKILSRHVNASDASTSAAGDVSFSFNNQVVAIEVKDRPLDVAEFAATIEKCRIAHVNEVIFVVRANSLLGSDLSQDEVYADSASQFSSGLNIYIESFADFCRSVLTLIGESGRRAFLEGVGAALGEQNADITHKWTWSELVRAI